MFPRIANSGPQDELFNMPAADRLAGLDAQNQEFSIAEYDLAYIIMAMKGKISGPYAHTAIPIPFRIQATKNCDMRSR
jgi:hypothetical protein